MAKGIYDLGNNMGFIYVVGSDGSTILQYLPNTPAGSFQAKSLANSSRSVGQNLVAVGKIVINSTDGTGDITGITIDGVNQISTTISYVLATSEATVASQIVDAINSHIPSGNNYTARLDQENATVYIYAPVSAGSSVNEEAISVVNTGNITVTTTALDGGADGDLTYDESTGYRFFLDANYGTGTCAGDGVALPYDKTNAFEITNYIVPRALNAINPIIDVTISGGVIAPQTRMSSITKYRVTNQSSATTDALTYISTDNFSEGDILTLFMEVDDSYFTVSNAGDSGSNMVLTSSSYKIGDHQYRNDIYSSITFYFSNGSFYEIGKGDSKPNKSYGSLTYGATTTWDVLERPNARLTLIGNTTLSVTEMVSGDKGTLIVTQGSSGGYSITFPANSHFKGGLQALSPDVGDTDIIHMYYNGVRHYFDISKDYSSL